MKGGKRENSGRKKIPDTQKKKPITLYMPSKEYEHLENLAKDSSISSVCLELVELGLQVKQENSKNKIRFIDLFSGLGGMRIAFEEAVQTLGLSAQCVFASEIKKDAILAYKTYFNEKSIHNDITKIPATHIPDFDILLAGFPCQAFSSAGNRLGFQDTRGTLFFEIERILKEKKPYAFILENVEGLLNHNKGETLSIMLIILQNLGYHVTYQVLDGKDFGLAQSRKRIYFVGTKDTEVLLENFQNSLAKFADIQEHRLEVSNSSFTNLLIKKYKPEELFGMSIKDKRGGKKNIHSWDISLKGEVSQTQRELLNQLLKERRKKKWAESIQIDWMDGMPLTENQIASFFPHPDLHNMLLDLKEKGYLVFEHPKALIGKKRLADSTKEKGYNIVTGKLSFEFSKILDPNDLTPTLVATDISKLGVFDFQGIRQLTRREGLRLFGFPESYSLDFITKEKSYDLLGNTVCIPVVKQVAIKLLKALF